MLILIGSMTFEKQKVNVVYQNLLQRVTLIGSKGSDLVCHSSFPSASQSLLQGDFTGD